MLWAMQCIDDGLESGKFSSPTEITTPTIRHGPRSISDAIMTQLSLKKYILGEWLDGLDAPTHVKQKARFVFESHHTWRNNWHPIVEDMSDPLDSSWVVTWAKPHKDLMNFIELMVYLPSAREECVYRQAVRNQTTPKELMTQSPFAGMVAELTTAMRMLVTPGPIDMATTKDVSTCCLAWSDLDDSIIEDRVIDIVLMSVFKF